MAKGPKGERRPADVNARAVMVARIATGEIEDKVTDDGKNAAAVALVIPAARALPPMRLSQFPASNDEEKWDRTNAHSETLPGFLQFRHAHGLAPWIYGRAFGTKLPTALPTH